MSAPGEAKARRARRRASPQAADTHPVVMDAGYREAEG
jgi:hypothetical protein